MAEPVALLLDPDDKLCAEVTHALAKHGVRVERVKDVADVLGRRETPALVILGVDPPAPLGWSLCSRLKKSPALKSVPLVFTSKQATEDDFASHRKLATRADAYLRKPYPIDALVALLRPLLKLSGPTNGGSSKVIVDQSTSLSSPPAPATPTPAPTPAPTSRPSPAPAAAASGGSSGRIFGPLAKSSASSPLAAAVATAAAGPGTPAASEFPASATVLNAPLPVAPETSKKESAHGESSGPKKVADGDVETALLRKEVERLRKDLDEARKTRPRTTTSSNLDKDREIHSLRETIHKKDAELLDLQGAMSAREREILDAKDRLREAERARTAVEAKLLDMERELMNALEDSDNRLAGADQEAESARARIAELEAALEETMSATNAQREEADALRAEADAEREARLEGAERVSTLEHELAQARATIAAAEKRLVELVPLEAEAKKAVAKLEKLPEMHNKVRKALGVALALLDEE